MPETQNLKLIGPKQNAEKLIGPKQNAEREQATEEGGEGVPGNGIAMLNRNNNSHTPRRKLQ